MSEPVPFMCLELQRVATLVWSCAHARALQEHTRLVWEPYRESKVLNAVYSVLFWKGGPGIAEIRQDQAAVELAASRHFDQMLDAFLDSSAVHGPTGVATYADAIVRARAYSLGSVQELFTDASRINAGVVGEAQDAIRTLAQIKLGSALVLTGTGCALALTGAGVALVSQVGLVKLSADVTAEAIKEQQHIGKNVKGVAYQLGKFGLEKAGDKGADALTTIGEKGIAKYGTKLQFAQQRIERYSKELARRARSRKAVKVARRLENSTVDHAVASRTVTTSQRAVKAGKVAGKALPVVFAAWDVLDAITDYNEDVGAAAE